MIININLHPDYCELSDGGDCPCLNKNEDTLAFTICRHFDNKLGGIWVDGNGYHIVRLDECRKADGLPDKPQKE